MNPLALLAASLIGYFTAYLVVICFGMDVLRLSMLVIIAAVAYGSLALHLMKSEKK